MVTITNGTKTFRVTAGAVKVYEGLGFRVVSDKELEDIKQAEQEHFDDTDESVDSDSVSTDESSDEEDETQTDADEDGLNAEQQAYIDELLEKPLSQWSNEEVKEFVKIKNIDTTGAQKISQVRGIIKTYLEEQSKNV